jgi:hypothetical protein
MPWSRRLLIPSSKSGGLRSINFAAYSIATTFIRGNPDNCLSAPSWTFALTITTLRNSGALQLEKKLRVKLHPLMSNEVTFGKKLMKNASREMNFSSPLYFVYFSHCSTAFRKTFFFEDIATNFAVESRTDSNFFN